MITTLKQMPEKYPTNYKNLYNYVKNNIVSKEEFLKWIVIPWKSSGDRNSSVNKMEACFRLYSILGMHPLQNKYQLCIGNFNTGSTRPCEDSDIEKLLLSSIKDNGDKSDETFENETKILTISCKDWKTNHVGDFDIAALQRGSAKYHKIHLIGLCVRKKCDLHKTMIKSHHTSKDDSEIVKKAFSNDLVFDREYLSELFPFLPDTLPTKTTNTLIPYFHQELCCDKLIQRLLYYDKVILNAIPRSGKTAIICLYIQRLYNTPTDDEQNVLLITLRPSETLSEYKKFLGTYLSEYNTVFLNETKNKEPTTKKKNVFVCSKQFLQTKTGNTRKISWLEKKKFSIVFIDEPHDGGATELAEKVYNTYCKDTKTVFVTATCKKLASKYIIENDNIIKWDLDDVSLCRSMTDDDKEVLKNKHGSENIISCLKKFSVNSIRETYMKYPIMILNTSNFAPDIKASILQTNSGWSINALLSLDNNDNFLMGDQVVKFFQSVFGKVDRNSIITTVDKKCYLYEWKQLMIQYKSRITSVLNPLIILMFIDRTKINKLGNAIKTLLENEILPIDDVVCEYEVIILNTNENKGVKSVERIEQAYIRCKNRQGKGVIVITGQMCSAAASIHKCDIVMLLHDGHSWDNYFQQVFRPLTPDEGKTCGIICDFNNRRSLNFIAVLSENIYGKSDVESIHKIIEQDIVKIQCTHWYDPESNVFEQKERSNYQIAQIIHQNWLQDVGATRMIIQTLSTSVKVSKKTVIEYNNYFNNVKSKNNKTNIVFIEDIPDELQGEDRDIDDGINCNNDKECNKDGSDMGEEDIITVNMFQEVFRYIVVLLVIMTIDINSSEFSEMCSIVKEDISKKTITINLLRGIWGIKIPDNIIELMSRTYNSELIINNDTLCDSIRYLKERFVAVRKNSRSLYDLIEEFLVPHDIERRNNAEISTPQQLRKDMLDQIPKCHWTKGLTIFEPCCGKGGFLIDIVDRFMSGLEDKIPDEEKRIKFILEKLIYFADINPLNIYICDTILNPNKKYKLNNFTGDTLKLDIKEEWNKTGFIYVIGNPPYNSSGNTGTGNTIWQHFTRSALEKWLRPKGRLVFVHPPGWRKPNTVKGKFYGMFDLMTRKNRLKFLSIHGIKDGQKTFGCGTRYDWYVIINMSRESIPTYITTVNDEMGKNICIDMDKFNWLPNYNIDTIRHILADEYEEKCPIMYNRTSYGADKKDRVSTTQTDEFKYPCIHSTPKSGTRYMYSNVNDRGHFGVSKVIFGDSGINNIIIDMEGEYGMTQHSMAIQVDNLDEAKNISTVLSGGIFNDIIKSCMYSSYAIDWNIFKDMKKDFWKGFI